MATFTRTNLHPGDRILVEGYSRGEGTFVRYGDPRHALPDTHISKPGMRIAYINLDAYRGPSPIWEDRLLNA